MQAVEIPTNSQIKHIKALIKALGEHVRPYAIGELTLTEAVELTSKLEVMALYAQLPPQQQEKAFEYMVKQLEIKNDHKQK